MNVIDDLENFRERKYDDVILKPEFDPNLANEFVKKHKTELVYTYYRPQSITW